MSDQSVDSGHALAAIATSAAAGADPSEAIVGLLAANVAADAGVLVRRFPTQSGGRVAASFGYSGETLDFLLSPTYRERDPAYRSITTEHHRPKVRHWQGMAGNYRNSYTAQRHLLPVGFNNGTTALLMTPDGHYVGDLHVSMLSAETPSARFMEWVDRVSPLIAELVESCALRGTNSESRYLLRSGSSTPRLLADGRSVSQAVADRLLRYVMADCRLDEQRFRTWRGYWRDSDSRWYSVRAESSPAGAVVSIAPEVPPFSLTERELQILTGCVEGLTSGAIARQLGLSERTVAHRLEGIYRKLGVGSRASSVVASIELGLRYIAA